MSLYPMLPVCSSRPLLFQIRAAQVQACNSRPFCPKCQNDFPIALKRSRDILPSSGLLRELRWFGTDVSGLTVGQDGLRKKGQIGSPETSVKNPLQAA
jgi:hypothetical protein